MESPAGRQAFRCRLLEGTDSPIREVSIKSWIESKAELLSSNGIILSVLSFTKWTRPTPVEFHRMARIAGMDLPEAIFGPTQLDIALAKFQEGNVAECARILEVMCTDKEDPILENNLGFCKLILGQHETALGILDTALKKKYDPLFETNMGIALFLLGKVDQAISALLKSLEWLKENSTNQYSKDNPLYVLFLDRTTNAVKIIPDLPLIATIHINLWLMGNETKGELQKNIEETFPSSYRDILLLVEDEPHWGTGS